MAVWLKSEYNQLARKLTNLERAGRLGAAVEYDNTLYVFTYQLQQGPNDCI